MPNASDFGFSIAGQLPTTEPAPLTPAQALIPLLAVAGRILDLGSRHDDGTWVIDDTEDAHVLDVELRAAVEAAHAAIADEGN